MLICTYVQIVTRDESENPEYSKRLLRGHQLIENGIEPKQLSKEFEPVGICLVVKGNKALVRYKEEKSFRNWKQYFFM